MTRYTKSMREAMEEVWANDITLDEGKMKTIATMFADGKSAKQIAKKMKLPVATVKTILGEEDIQEAMLWEFSDGQIAKLKKDYASLKGAKISLARANQLRNIFDKITNSQLPKLYKADIPFLSAMALSRMIKKGIQVPKGVRLSAFREQTWEQILIDEKIQQGFAVRYSLDGKRLVQAYKTQKDAEHRAKILKSMGGVKDVSITQHSLNFKEEDFNIVNELGATTLKEYAEYIEYMAKNSSQAKAIANMFKGKTGGGESKSDGSEVRIDSAIDVESIHKQVVAKYGDDVRVLTKEQDESAFNIAGVETSSERTIEEKIQPYMISYSQYGKHYGFEGGDSLSDIQNIAQKLRKKGFTIDKMGRYNPPLDAKLRTGKTGIESDMTPADIERLKKQGLQAEAYTVQITKTDGSKLVIGKYKTPAEAEKYISWYKTGDMSKTKSVKVIKEASNTIYKVKKDGKVVFTGKYNQVLTYRKQHGGEIVTEEVKKEEDKEVSNAPKKKFGDIKKEITDKNKDSSKGDVETLRQQLGVLRQKLEIEKHKAVKPQPNKDTGEVPLTIGLAHKLLRDKDKTKEGVGEKNEEVIGEANIVFKAKAKEGGYFLVLKRDTSGMSGSQDKFLMRHLKGNKVKELGSHPSLDGAKTFGKNKGIIEEVELDEGVKLANLVGKSIAHLGMYVELAEDIKKEYFKTNSQVSMFIKAKADQASKSVPKLIKELKRPGIWNEQVEVNEDIIRRSFKSLKEKIDIWGIGQQQPAKVRKAMDVARRMSGNYSGAVKEIEKIAKDLSKLPIVKKALLHANEEKKITERGGANTSSKQGSFARSRKPKYRFGYRVAEKEPKGDKELEEIRIRPKNAIGETDLTKSQVKKVHHKADELPKKSFRDKYGKKKGDSIRYAVATNQTKKKLGIENKNHPAKKKWETLTTKKTNKDDSNKDILPNYQEPTQKTDPMNIQTKEPEKKRTDNGTKSDKIDVNPRIDYHA